MCGIAGFFSARGGNTEDQSRLDTMLETLWHRGPDGHGSYLNEKHGVALGHTRLSINDLATGHQPLHSLDKRFTLTVNGEFYDFKRHRSLAMADGYRFSCKSDSEIALSLYEKYGLDFMKHLRGEFAFAFYDHQEKRLILARDRFGIRPLFYHISRDTVYYGSEIKSLIAHPHVPRELCPKSALNQLMQTIVPGTSAFKDIHSLAPGTMLIIDNKDGRLEVKHHRYWDYTFPLQEDRNNEAPAEEWIERVRDTLIQSIVFRLEADVPVGSYLSGGIDSCCILGLATGAMQSPVKAFTISFDHDSYDEAKIAVEMAESMGADQEIIRLQAEDLYGLNYIQTVWHAERSFYNTLGVAKNLMSRRVRECGYKSVVTGEGADELFAGYPAFKRDMILHGLGDLSEAERQEYRDAMDRSNKLFKGAILAEEPLSHPAFEELCGFTPSWIQPWMATLELARPMMNPDWNSELKDYDPIAAIAGQISKEALDGRHPLDKAQYTWSKTQLEGQILNWGGDRVDMANSMESRPAFLDHHLAELATQIPPKYRIHNNIEKWVLREAVKGVLPEVLYKREKFAFMAPPAHTDPAKQKKLDELLDTYLTPKTVEEAGLFDPKKVKSFMDGYLSDKDPVSLTRKDTLVNHLLCVQIMHDLFIKRPQPYKPQ